MSDRISIIMYHYVRELKGSRFPGIKGLPLESFSAQLGYITKHYRVISMEELIASLKSDRSLPKNALLLTFDDGYIDHFINIFPILDELRVQGSFFPPARAVLEHKVLDVNKIHFILASAPDKHRIIKDIFLFLDCHRTDFGLKENAYYFDKLAKRGRFDTKEAVFIKRLLQKELPEKLRREIVKDLFNKYVTRDEAAFAEELYVSVNQLRQMKEAGMFIGSHGFDHYWLDTLDEIAQEREVELSLDFLCNKVGCDIKEWVMCYPYGSYNDTLLNILKRKRCSAGLTSESRVADIKKDSPLVLPRLDTNDLKA